MAADVEWRAVPGYEGLYEVSSDGQVRSLGRARVSSYRTARISGRMLKLDGCRAYLMAALSRDGRVKRRTVHSLVAEAFIGPCPGGMWVDHINQDKRDNRFCNLRYATPSENRRNCDYVRAQSGVKFVHFNPAKSNHKNPWQARVRRKFLGQFPTVKEAALAVDRYLSS